MAWRPWFQTAHVVKGQMKSKMKAIKRWDIMRGDWVQVMAGKDKGEQGKVVAVMRKKQEVLVEGLNCDIITRNDARLLQSAPLAYKDIALVDPSDGKPCGVKYKYTEEGKKVRVSTRTGQPIPKPLETTQRRDIKYRSGYVGMYQVGVHVNMCHNCNVDGPYDTSSEDAIEQTYVPALTTFEEEMEIVYPKLPPLVHLDVDKLSKMSEREKKLEEKVYW